MRKSARRCVFGILLVSTGALAAPPVAVPAARNVPAGTGAKERRLHVASAEASSYLVNDWNKFQENYLPLYVGDDDPKTAWTLKTEGIGEWLRVHVTPMEGATRLRMKIRNGYQKTPRLWEANSRAKDVTITLLPSKTSVEVTLTDRSDWQEVVVEQPAGAFEAVELRIKSVFPGKKYDDLCISDLQLHVTAKSSDNPAFEKQRFEKLAAWKAERAAAARMFQSKLGQSLPIAAQYQATSRPDPASGAGPQCDSDVTCWIASALSYASRDATKRAHAQALETATTLTAGKYATMTPVRISSRDKRPTPTVDGLCTPRLDSCQEDPCFNAVPLPLGGQLGYLDAEALALVEQTGLPTFAQVVALEPTACHAQRATTFAWALRDNAGADGRPAALRALLLVSCGMVQGREGSFPFSQPQLLVYGVDGRLEVVAQANLAAIVEWERRADGPKLARATTYDSMQGASTDIVASAGVVAAK